MLVFFFFLVSIVEYANKDAKMWFFNAGTSKWNCGKKSSKACVINTLCVLYIVRIRGHFV